MDSLMFSLIFIDPEGFQDRRVWIEIGRIYMVVVPL
jgi:hypothetical protein